ncbi:MAG: glycosyltransferase [Bacteroidales bacterium]|jgi:glycosyltransferase involved in cell wall biosynthesis|nr:glycosyltransferase [Bacteroidales bacterium]
MPLLVSIITPTYNHQTYIAECIQSVLEQSFSQWEMIIIDDGSTDFTVKIANDYASKDSRINVITQENIGIFRLCETYNRALGIAEGKYIAILEGDDFWESDKLEYQVEVLESDPDMILSWGQAKNISSDKKTVYNICPDVNSEEFKYFNNNPVGAILNILLYKDSIPALTVMVRKDALIKLGGFLQFNGMPTIDIPTLLQLSLVGKFGFIPQPLGCWRNYAGQATKVYPAVLIEGYFNLVKEFLASNSENPFVKTINPKIIFSFFQRKLIVAYSRAGRFKLIRKEFSGARRDYIQSIHLPGGEYLWKLRSLTGLLFSLFHLDIEWFARLLKRPTYNE